VTVCQLVQAFTRDTIPIRGTMIRSGIERPARSKTQFFGWQHT